MTAIDDLAGLRSFYPPPKERALRKVLSRLDKHCIRFIELSPFCILASSTADASPDLSPRGGDPGFVRVLDDRTLLLPDRPGNNRLDSLANLAINPSIAMLFLVPGVDETLRVYGTVEIVACAPNNPPPSERKPSVTELRVTVSHAFFHCAKALMRSRLWSEDARVDRKSLPTLGQILKDQMQDEAPVETQEAMVHRYTSDL